MVRLWTVLVSLFILGLCVSPMESSSQAPALFTDITEQALGDAAFVHFGAFADSFPSTPGLPGRPAQLVWLGGVTIADFNGDGWQDIFVTNGNRGANALYINNADGVPTFRDVATLAGVSFPEDEAAAAVAGDLDNDGDTDLYVTNVGIAMGVPINRLAGPNRLLINDGNDERGNPHFRDTTVTAKAAGDASTRSQLASLVDFDRDGDLDIFIAAHTPIVTPAFLSDSPDYPFKREPNRVDLLLRNDLKETGELAFTDVTNLLRKELSATLGRDGRPILDSRFTFDGVWIDFDIDGWPDLFQANDLGTVGLFHNEGEGRFRYLSSQAGLTNTGSWMSLTPGDVNGDSRIDFFATNVGVALAVPTFANSRHALYLNRGDGTFADVAGQVGVANPSTDGDASGDFGWGAQMLDFDNDGDLDLFFIGNWWPLGAGVRQGIDFIGRPFDFEAGGHTNRGHLFENRGTDADGRPVLVDLMESAAGRAEVGIDNPHDGRAVAIGDLNNDGSLDLVIANVSGRATGGRDGGFESLGLYRGGLIIYKNNGSANPSLKLRLIGVTSNRDAIGARVTLVTDEGHQVREVRAGEGHLSCNSLDVVFGLGQAKAIQRLEIRWPSGSVQTLQNLPSPSQGMTLTIIEETPGYASQIGDFH